METFRKVKREQTNENVCSKDHDKYGNNNYKLF